MSSIFYARGLTNSAMGQPVVFITIFLLFIFIFRPIITQFSLKIFLIVFLLTLLLTIQEYLIGLKYGIINEFGRIVFPLLSSLLLANWYGRHVTNRRKFMNVFLKTVVFFLIIDLCVRLIQSGKVFPIYNRYDLKVGGLIFLDSNFNGFLSACLWIYSLESKIIKLKSSASALYFILILYSFSLAVYVGLLAVILYKICTRNIISMSIFAPIGGILVWYTYILISSDGSFLTKIEILEFAYNYILDADIGKILIGLGSGNLIYYVGRASHTLVGIGAELGLLFTLIVFVILIALYFVQGLSTLILFIVIVALAALFPIAYLSPVYCIISMHLINMKSSSNLTRSIL